MLSIYYVDVKVTSSDGQNSTTVRWIESIESSDCDDPDDPHPCPGCPVRLSSVSNYMIVYPNPAQENIWIGFQLLKAQSVHYELIDFTGRIIREEYLIYETKGEYKVCINTKGIVNGRYYLRLSKDDFVEIQSIFITK